MAKEGPRAPRPILHTRGTGLHDHAAFGRRHGCLVSSPLLVVSNSSADGFLSCTGQGELVFLLTWSIKLTRVLQSTSSSELFSRLTGSELANAFSGGAQAW